MTSEWFNAKVLCRAGIKPGSPQPSDTLQMERERRSAIAAMKEGRNYIDRYMLDLLASDNHTDFQVFAMLHTDEDYLRDVTVDIPENIVFDELDEETLDVEDEDELDEIFRVRLRERIRRVNRKLRIVRTHGPIPYSVGEGHVDIERGFFPNVSLVHHLPIIISAGYPAFSSPMPGEGNSPVSVNWIRYKEASQHWQEWGHKLSGAECQVWFDNATKLNTTRETESPERHPLGKKAKLTWTALTFLKIIYGTETLLSTELALRFQDQFPHADLGQWVPNTDRQHVDNSALEQD